MAENRFKVRYSYFTFAVRIAIGIFFIYSGVSKFASLALFRYSVNGLKLFFGPAREAVTLLIPAVEIILGVLLVIGLFTDFAFIHLNVLLLGFALISFYAISIKYEELCHYCGQGLNLRYDVKHLIVAFIFFIINILALVDRYKIWSLDRYIRVKRGAVK